MTKIEKLLKPFWLMWILGTLFPFILFVTGASGASTSIWQIQIGMGLIFNPIGTLALYIVPTTIANAGIVTFVILTIGQFFTTFVYALVYYKLESGKDE
jgi:hypothetical protein